LNVLECKADDSGRLGFGEILHKCGNGFLSVLDPVCIAAQKSIDPDAAPFACLFAEIAFCQETALEYAPVECLYCIPKLPEGRFHRARLALQSRYSSTMCRSYAIPL